MSRSDHAIEEIRSNTLSPLSVSIETFDSYRDIHRRSAAGLVWHCLFVMPFWLETVHRHLGAAGEPHIVAVRQGDHIIALAPLAIEGDTAAFLGSHEVCDYQDVVCAPDKKAAALDAVMAHLTSEGVRRLDLRTLRPDAVVLDALKALMPQTVEAGLSEADVTFEASLPGDWETYLMQLKGKQRHEVRRKVRRLENHGPFSYRLAANGDDLDGAAADFIDLFKRNRTDKAHFMSDTMSAYFQDLIRSLNEESLLRLYFLDVGGQPVSTVLCFDYNGVRYLYNSGYDETYNSLSVGVLSKVFSIKAAIEMGCRRYDFLKGAEVYKKRIGGNEVPLYRLRMEI